MPSLRCRLQEDSKELGIILKRLFHRVSSTVTNEIIEMTERNLVKSVGKDYAWPGNIRELQTRIESGILRSSGDVIELEQLFI